MIGVAIGTAALVIVLSVFNGLEDLIRSLHSTFDPEIKITATLGKSFPVTENFKSNIESIDGVDIVTEVIEDIAVVKYRELSMPVRVKGVGDNFLQQSQLGNSIVAGNMRLQENGVDYAIIGRGVQYALSISPTNDFYSMQVFYPRNVRAGTIDPTKLINRKNIIPGSVFAIEKQYDENYIFVPLDFAVELFAFDNKRTSLEIKTKPGHRISQVQANLKNLLGEDFQVLSRDEQHSGLLKAIHIEKLFLFITFSFILAIASFNIFFSLTMLAIDKKKDIEVLYALGANDNIVKRIFLTEGAIIAFSGAIFGLTVGLVVCWLQQTYGFVSMGMQTSVLDAYPVKMQFQDFLYTALSIIVITFLASYRPAQIATYIRRKVNI
jgi:lipoprotein-releasing system permease protein